MFLVTAFDKDDKEIAVDLEQVTDANPMIAACERKGIDGVALVGRGLVKNAKYAFFIPMDVFVEFILWKLVNDE